jgi:hypothetical protein
MRIGAEGITIKRGEGDLKSRPARPGAVHTLRCSVDYRPVTVGQPQEGLSSLRNLWLPILQARFVSLLPSLCGQEEGTPPSLRAVAAINAGFKAGPVIGGGTFVWYRSEFRGGNGSFFACISRVENPPEDIKFHFVTGLPMKSDWKRGPGSRTAVELWNEAFHHA